MKKLNKKGFLITGTVYALLILFVVLIMGILTIFVTRNRLIMGVVDDIKDQLDSPEETEYRTLMTTGTFSEWKNLQTTSTIQYRSKANNLVETIPNTGNLDDLFSLNAINVGLNTSKTKASLSFNGTDNSFASATGGVVLSGNNNYITTNEDVKLDTKKELSLNIEFYNTGDNGGIFTNSATPESLNGGIKITVENNGIVVYARGKSIASGITYATESNTLPLNDWVRLRVTIDTNQTDKNKVIHVYYNDDSQKLIDKNPAASYVAGFTIGNGQHLFGVDPTTNEFLETKVRRINLFSNTIETDLVYKYEFNKDTKDQLVDYSNNKYNGLIVGAFEQADFNRYALTFNPTSNVLTPVVYKNESSFSLQAIVIPTDTVNEQIIVGSDTDSNAISAGIVIKNNKVVFENEGTDIIVSQSDITPGKKYDITVASNNGFAKMHINGIAEGEANYDVTPPNNAMVIGNTTNGTRAFTGYILDVRVWNKALKEADIRNLRLSRLDPSANLLAHYTMSEGSGPVLFDTSGRGNNATITNPLWTTANPQYRTIYLEIEANACGGTPFSLNGTDSSVTIDNDCKVVLQTSTTNASITTDYVVAKDKPTKLMYLYNGTTYDLYVDGVKQELTPIGNPADLITFNHITLGKNEAGNNNFFKGKLYSLIFSSGNVTPNQAIRITGGGIRFDKVFTYSNSEIVYKFIEFR